MQHQKPIVSDWTMRPISNRGMLMVLLVCIVLGTLVGHHLAAIATVEPTTTTATP